MRHQKKTWRSRAHGDAAYEEFERALAGDSTSERTRFDPAQDRKTLQLCRQVQHALMLALSGECDDEILREFYVAAVEPLGNASQLLVRVWLPRTGQITAWGAMARLSDRAARLRGLVAQSICRKRVPALMFVVTPWAEEVGHDSE